MHLKYVFKGPGLESNYYHLLSIKLALLYLSDKILYFYWYKLLFSYVCTMSLIIQSLLAYYHFSCNFSKENY